ncbi:MAG TPA: GNAT family N-acetyltransferase [Candidatus Dormibacteraeota bacterium]|jgi:putative acetyltransferase|nr:GNAT family N-acetyltransferase [Candidatus Dormibacteraeota bacterium]
MDAPPVLVREARDGDAAGLIALIGSVFAEYPGVLLDVDGEMPHLRAIATSYARWGGRFWVAERDGAVVGSIGIAAADAPATPYLPEPLAAAPAPEQADEIHHLYVHRSARRAGLGGRLLAQAEAAARARGARRIVLWSDTRFLDAHGFYLRRGYLQQPETRDLGDISRTTEYQFIREL